LASGAPAGTKIAAGWPTEAATPARAAAALPVEAGVTTRAPRSRAFTTATALARSFSEPLGWTVSSFTQTWRRPRPAARRGASYSGVQPMRRGGTSAPASIGSSGR
jgi:hypothetical protein